MKIKITFICIASFLLAGLSTLSAASPILISEIFYDSPLNESHEVSAAQGVPHHNGEFIELFNPTNNDIDLTGWKLSDTYKTYYFPINTRILSRSTIVVAYQYPHSNFHLSDLFPSISGIPESGRIFYQSDIELNNDGEYITLKNAQNGIVDQMSYKNYSITGPKATYWDIQADNGDWGNTPINVNLLVSLQRTNFQYSSTSEMFTPKVSDYSKMVTSPLSIPGTINFATIYDNTFPPVDPNTDDPQPAFDTNLPVGSLPGQASVSPTGAATYQIPIEVPPGINGMQPQISVVYNSQGDFGSLGIGWDIASGSAITRGNKNIYNDSINNTIKLDNTDALYLDGQRLILLSGTPFVDAEYGTEIENYARIKFYVSGFVVTTNDGKTMDYGQTTDSRLSNVNGNDYRTLAWKLNRVIDAYANTMLYFYTDNGQYLSSINYAGQSVEFGYVSNTFNPRNSYINTFRVSQSKLLNTITTKSESTTLKTYGFVYKPDNRLKNITETASDGNKFNVTKVNWGAESQMKNDFYSNALYISGVISSRNEDIVETDNMSIYFADVNGDGYKDFIRLWQGDKDNNGYIDVILYNPIGKYYPDDADFHKEFAWNDKNIQVKLMCQDINKDGKDEIVFLGVNYIKTYTYENNLLTENTINNFLGNAIYLIDFGVFKYSQGGYSSLFEDVNKDSYPDLVIIPYGEYDGVKRYSQVYYGSSSGYTSINISTDEFSIANCYVYATGGWDGLVGNGDFNADGKSDIILYGNIDSSSYIHDYKGATVFFDPDWNNLIKDTRIQNNMMYDFNNDGITDIITQNNESGNYAWKLIPGGINFTYQNPINLPFIHSSPANCNEERDFSQMIDYNGDGFMDVVIADETWKDHDGWTWLTKLHDFVQTDWYFYKNNGAGTFTLEKQFTTNERLPKTRPTISDINGDGIDDLIFARKPNDAIRGKCNYTAFTIPNANRRNFVTGITNGMGQTNSFAYKNFSDYDQTATTGVVRNLKAPLLVVDTQTEPDGSITSYTFEKPRVHTEGKGFLGFTTVTATNVTHKTNIVSNYEINDTYFGVSLSSQTVTNTNGTALSGSSQKNSVLVIDAAKKRYIPVITKQTSTDGLKGISQTNTTDYSSYPDKITQSTTTGDLTTKVETTYTGPTGATPYLPSSVTTTRTQNGTSIRVTNYAYKFDKNKKTQSTETTDPGDINSVVTTTSFDSWGHTQNVAVTANGITRSSSVSYTSPRSSSGRFIQSKTNALLETTQYSWNETTGLLDNETDYQNHVTSYAYNSFGRLTGTTTPDGISTSKTVYWLTNGSVSGARYYSYATTTGAAPVTVYYDALGREIQRDTYGLNDKKISVFTEYRPDGKVDRVSEPVFEEDTKIWDTYAYHPDYGYVTSVTTPMGTTTTAINNLTTSVSTPTEGTSVTVQNAAGQTLSSTVNGKTVNYAYYASGLTHTSTPEGGQAVTMVYDLQGQRKSLTDPDGGIVETVYNGFGELTEEKQTVHSNTEYVKTTNNYYPNGLMNYIVRKNITTSNTVLHSETTTYVYDTELNHTHRVKTIQISNANKQTFTYDGFDRVTGVEETIGNHVYASGKILDGFGRVERETYPSGFYTVNHYDTYSNLTEVTDQTGRSIWKAIDANAKGQLLHVSKGGKITAYGIDGRGMPTSIYASGVVDMTYLFDGSGNLSYRTDNLTNQREDFGYDGLNRLTNWTVTRGGIQTPYGLSYDPANPANIKTKSDLSNFTMNYGEGNGKPHALTSIAGVPTNFPTADLNVTYTDFKKIEQILEGNKYYTLSYGVDDQRRMSTYSIMAKAGNEKLPVITYYIGNYEEQIDQNTNNVRKIHYLSGGAMLIQNNGVDSLLYAYSDYQGSLIALTDANGNVVEKYAYDPWGARRNPTDWTQKDLRTKWIVNRGYTGHEHLDAFGIINMNGRVYDPLTAQFFSPDSYVQAPGDWLNYNRYGYCMGNPFRYTDPSGNNFFYVIPSVSYSYYGGLQVNVSAGIGVPSAASYGITLGYNFKYSNWSATANASINGLYAYAGYDSKAGFIAGAGFGFGIPGLGGFTSNLLSAGVNYSQNGGFSLNMFGSSMGNNGVSFDPSIGASATMAWGKTAHASAEINQNNNSDKVFPGGEAEFNEWVDNNIDRKDFGLNKTSIEENPNYKEGDIKYWRNPSDGILYEVNLITHSYRPIGGVTIRNYNGWGGSSDIYLNNSGGCEEFTAKFDHELIHAFHNSMFLNQSLRNKYDSYTEHIAYQFFYNNGFRSQGVMDMLNSTSTGFYKIYMPPYLIPIK